MEGNNTSVQNQASFRIGAYFYWAVLSSAQLEINEDTFNLTIVDLVWLIDSLEGQPEADALQKTLRSLIRDLHPSSAQVGKAITDASESYSARLSPEQRWYFKSGIIIPSIIVDAYFEDETAIKESLASIQSLIKIAPQGTSEEIIGSMQSLVDNISKTNFATEDYYALIEGTMAVETSIRA